MDWENPELPGRDRDDLNSSHWISLKSVEVALMRDFSFFEVADLLEHKISER